MKKKFIVLFEILILLFSSFSNVFAARASAATSAPDLGTQYITSAIMTAGGGVTTQSEVSNQVTANWTFSIPGGTNVQAGQTMTVPIPSQFDMKSQTFQVNDPSGNPIATGQVIASPATSLSGTDGNVVLTFTQYAQDHNTSVIQGSFFVNTLWNKNLVSNGNTYTLDWGAGLNGQDVKMVAGFGSKAPVQKSGTRKATDNSKVDWTLWLNINHDNVSNFVVNDVAGPQQTFLPDTLGIILVPVTGPQVKLTGAAAQSYLNAQWTDTTVNFTVPTTTDFVKVYYTTQSNDNGASLYYTNTATGNSDQFVNRVSVAKTVRTDAGGKGYTLSNLTLKKVWADGQNQDGIQPSSVQIQLYKNGVTDQLITLNAGNNWTAVLNNLDVTANYIAQEINVPAGYTSTSAMSTSGGVNTLTFTNTHAPATTTISGTKTWNDANNQDGIRPASINVNLIADGATKPVATQTVTPDADGNWNYSFANVPVYANGKAITYTVTEDPVAGYTTTISGYNITNSYTPKTINLSGSKTWVDNNNQDGLRPTSITVNLIANGDTANPVATQTVTPDADGNWNYSFTNVPENSAGTPINYTVEETPVTGYTTTYNGLNITNTHTTETTSVSGTKTWVDNNNQDGMRPSSITVTLTGNGKVVNTQEVSADTGWKYSFTDLPMNSDGNPIVYSVSENNVPNYTSEKDGYDFTNTHTPLTTSVSGMKLWADNDNQDGIRPTLITVNLIANGDTANPVATQTVTPDASGNWNYNFNNIPQFANGKLITYTVDETPVAGYTTTYNGTNITNTHTPDVTSVTGTKTWDDNNNQDGMRPSSITVNLLADGNVVASQEVTAATNWEYAFNDLPVNANGTPITYTISENEVANYTTTINGTDITNIHTPEVTTLSGEKTWNDANNQDGIRPESITINLLANGKEVDSKTVTAADDWKYSFDNLDVYSEGTKIDYTITETPVADYTTEIDGMNVTNTHTPDVTTITGSKTWNDENNKDGIRPDSITVNLLADGKVVTSKTVTAKDGWKYNFENMPVYENGKPIVYSITEDAVKGYTTEVKGYNLTNTHKVVPAKTETTKPTTPTTPTNGNGSNSQTLPKTGSDNDLSAMIFGAMLLLLSVFGGFKVYRKNNQN